MRKLRRGTTEANNRAEIASLLHPEALAKDLRPMIEDSLAECGKDECRKGTFLTPVLTVFIVLGLTIRRDLSYSAVINWLVSGLRWLRCPMPRHLCSDGALSHARQRLGVEVFVRIFARWVARFHALPRDFHGRTSVTFDGTTATMPDTEGNRARFGTPRSGRGNGAFPQLRAVALLILPLRRIADIAFGPYKGKGTGEKSLMMELLSRIPYKKLLFLLDAGLFSSEFLFATRDHDTLVKLSGSVKPKRLPGPPLPDGSYLAVVMHKVLDKERSTATRKRWIKHKIVVRIIEFWIRGSGHSRLLTTILDPSISAKELVIHYHKRWDIEIAFDEIKTHQCATLRGQPPTVLRSKTPELVEQELYAMVIVYNLVRDLIYQGAMQHNHDPRDISFLDSLQCIIEAIPFVCFPDRALPADTSQYLLELIGQCTIDRPRRPRKNPRVVKVKMSKFKRKQSFHRSETININDDLHIIDAKAA